LAEIETVPSGPGNRAGWHPIGAGQPDCS